MDAEYRSLAATLGLEVQAFDKCLETGTHTVAVQREIDEGSQLGVSATPSWFINGRMITGLVSAETLNNIVSEEVRSMQETKNVSRGRS